MRTGRSLGLAAGALAVTALAAPAYGGGFELRTFDAKGAGMSNSFTAVADTPAAIAYNPAGMSQLDGMQGSATFQYIQAFIKFEPTDPAEGEANNERKPSYIPSLFGTAEITDNVTFGFGTFAPFGTNVTWRDDWPGRYIATLTRLEFIEAKPCISVKVPFSGNMIAVGTSLRIIRSSLHLEQALDFSAIGAEDGYVKLHGDTDEHLNYGWDLGILATFNDRFVSVGAKYTSAVENISVRGTAEFYNLTGLAAGAFPPATRAKTHLPLPDQFHFGVAVRPSEPLTISADFAWTNWSRLKQPAIIFPDLVDSSGNQRRSVLDLRWRDSYYVSVGGEYKVVPDTLALRAGLYWDDTPTHSETASPSIPDNTRYGFSVGFGLTPISALSMDVAYVAVFLKELEKDNLVGADRVQGGSPRANGEFNTYAHVVAVTFALKF